MTVQTAAGANVSIGTTKPAVTQAEFEADAYVDVGEVESIGEFGDTANSVNFTALRNSRVRKAKGARDAGMCAIVCGKDAQDLGQNALKAAQRTKFEYNIRIELADKTSAVNAKNTTFYYRALVMSAVDNPGNNENIVRTTFNLAINSEPLEIPAT